MSQPLKALPWMTPIIPYDSPDVDENTLIDDDEARGWVPSVKGTHLWVGEGGDHPPVIHRHTGTNGAAVAWPLTFVTDSAATYSGLGLSGDSIPKTTVRTIGMHTQHNAERLIRAANTYSVRAVFQSRTFPDRVNLKQEDARKDSSLYPLRWWLLFYLPPPTTNVWCEQVHFNGKLVSSRNHPITGVASVNGFAKFCADYPFAVWHPERVYPSLGDEGVLIPYVYDGPPFPRLNQTCPFPGRQFFRDGEYMNARECKVVGRYQNDDEPCYIVEVLNNAGRPIVIAAARSTIMRAIRQNEMNPSTEESTHE